MCEYLYNDNTITLTNRRIKMTSKSNVVYIDSDFDQASEQDDILLDPQFDEGITPEEMAVLCGYPSIALH
tara:strand:+ start:268 stop:477 length:210 start_codon:yes stop_codon:yes gene_type:complete